MRMVKVCGRIVGVQQTNMSALYERRVTQKAKVIAKDSWAQPVAVHYQLAVPSQSKVSNATSRHRQN